MVQCFFSKIAISRYITIIGYLLILGSPTVATSQQSYRVFASNDQYHLGDENIGSWPNLWGVCIDLGTAELAPLDTVKVVYKSYGLETAYLQVGSQRQILPPQMPLQGKRRPNYWSSRKATEIIVRRSNRAALISICSKSVAAAGQPVDYDDWMIANIIAEVSNAPVKAPERINNQPSLDNGPAANVKLTGLQGDLDEKSAQLRVIKELLLQQSRLQESGSGINSVALSAFRELVADIEADIGSLKSAAKSNYNTSIFPNNPDTDLSAWQKSKNFPPVPYYVAGRVGNGEFWLEPIVDDSGELLHRLNFVDPNEQTERIASNFDLTLDQLSKIRAALHKVYEWSETAKRNSVRRRFDKTAVCFPSDQCEEKVKGNTSTQIDFLIYEDGATGARIVRNKGAFAEPYNMSIESAAMLVAYLDFVAEAATAEFNAGTLNEETLNEMFD